MNWETRKVLSLSADCEIPQLDSLVVGPRDNDEVIELNAGDAVSMATKS